MSQLELYEENIIPSDDGTEMSIIEPHNAEEEEPCKKTGTRTGSDLMNRSTNTYDPEGDEGSDSQSDLDGTQEAWGRNILNHRLSVPPSCKLEPSVRPERPLPSTPHKSDPLDTGYHPHPVYAVDEWEVRTPSPVKSIREGISTPPLIKRRGLTPAALMSAITSSWKRRGTPSSQYSNDLGSGRTSRSVS